MTDLIIQMLGVVVLVLIGVETLRSIRTRRQAILRTDLHTLVESVYRRELAEAGHTFTMPTLLAPKEHELRWRLDWSREALAYDVETCLASKDFKRLSQRLTCGR